MRKLCNGACRMNWSGNRRLLTVDFAGRTLVLPIAAGRSLPDLPSSGISVGDVPNDLTNARIIEQNGVSIAADLSTYLFTRAELRANLFQIPVH